MPGPALRAPADTLPQDWAALAAHLARSGHRLDLAVPPRQFAGGLGNLNYLLSIDGKPWVLRRPPLGPIPPGANDMAREHRVLSALSPHWSLVPTPLHMCTDPAVLGAPFLIMDYRPGLVIGGALPAALHTTKVGYDLSARLVELMAHLHSLDPERVGLASLGKPAGFLERAVAGWTKRADLTLDGSPRPAAMQSVVTWLTSRPAPAGHVTLLHNDLKLDNVVLDPRTLTPRAVLDWDMGSRGDPLFDVATLLSYWTEAGDPPCMHRLAQMPTASAGFWTRAAVLAAYAGATGRDVADFGYYRILAMFKLAVVFLQLEARTRRGGPVDPRLAHVAGLGSELMAFTCELLDDTRGGGGGL
ncbi:MAG: phosphotransferase family protein [Hyphomicrobiaceae bacterium]|nr:phosphotransferase family protein [Hyphomicrobiaceae bacterium]